MSRTTTLVSPVVNSVLAWRCRAVSLLVLLIAIVTVITGVACGSGGGSEPQFAQVTPDVALFDLDDFAPSGFKKVREYDVSGLPGAEAAYMGYFKPVDSEPVQYELRIYPDHATAIASGVGYAAEVTGEGALLGSDDVRWPEGTTDRRGGGGFSGSPTPLYGDYAVYGNVILLCEGRDSDQSLGRCAALLHAAGIRVEG